MAHENTEGSRRLEAYKAQYPAVAIVDRCFMNTFKHSQGSIEVQNNIFAFIAGQHPEAGGLPAHEVPTLSTLFKEKYLPVVRKVAAAVAETTAHDEQSDEEFEKNLGNESYNFLYRFVAKKPEIPSGTSLVNFLRDQIQHEKELQKNSAEKSSYFLLYCYDRATGERSPRKAELPELTAYYDTLFMTTKHLLSQPNMRPTFEALIASLR